MGDPLLFGVELSIHLGTGKSKFVRVSQVERQCPGTVEEGRFDRRTYPGTRPDVTPQTGPGAKNPTLPWTSPTDDWYGTGTPGGTDGDPES